MGSNYRLPYNVDLVFVIDSTGSMAGLIDKVKENALNLYPDLMDVMKKKSKHINSLRIRVIAFRDYLADDEKAMLTTDFFTLPDEAEDFKDTVSSIEADGGGDEPEDGLEALAFAIRSKWNNEPNTKKRQVIVVWSDASTHDIGFAKKSKFYPKSMAENFSELTRWWGDHQNSEGYMDFNAKRLILFTPDSKGWKDITNSWDNVIHYISEAGEGLEEVDYKQIINAIANSI